jgi:peroxiredoxin
VSQSPEKAVPRRELADYFQSWDALAAMIRRGQSFSGRERDCVFLNTGKERWADVSAITGLDLIDDGRAVATSDWDHDGDLDVWITNRTGPRVRFMRNNSQGSNRSLQFRLVGNTHNRDAIGARMEVHLAGGAKLIKSLRAGSGFLGQSSKWMHFGLGTKQAIQRVVVRWPDGFQETLDGIEADRRYTISRGLGSSQSRVDETPRHVRNVALALSPPEIPTIASPSEPARVVLSQRRTLPDLEYETLQGQRTKLEARGGKLTLLNLWTSSCANCMAELSELSAHESELRGRELVIVALSADELTASTNEQRRETAQAVVDRLGLHFAVGTAVPEAVRELTLLHSRVLYREHLPLPFSLLIDRQGRVAVIYKGRVSVDQLLSDLKLIEQPSADLAAIFPFAGRNGIDLFDLTAVGMAQAYEEAGYLDDAEQEHVRYIVTTRRALAAKSAQPTPKTIETLERTYQSLAMMLSRHGRKQEAAAVLEQAIGLFPKSQKLRQEASGLRSRGQVLGN